MGVIDSSVDDRDCSTITRSVFVCLSHLLDLFVPENLVVDRVGIIGHGGLFGYGVLTSDEKFEFDFEVADRHQDAINCFEIIARVFGPCDEQDIAICEFSQNLESGYFYPGGCALIRSSQISCPAVACRSKPCERETRTYDTDAFD